MRLFTQKKKRKGFTLVELVVVVAIIAILAFIAAPKFASMTENAKIATFESNHDVVKTAISLYMAENQGDLPPDASNANELPSAITKFIDGEDVQNKPADATYIWNKTTSTLTSTLTGLSKNAFTDIQSGKRPGSASGDGTNTRAYVLTFNPAVSD